MRILLRRVALVAAVALAFPLEAAASPKLRLDLEGVLEGVTDPGAVYKIQFIYLEGTEASISSPLTREAEIRGNQFRIRGIQSGKVYRVIVSKRSGGAKHLLAFPQNSEWVAEVKVGAGTNEPVRLTVVDRDGEAVLNGEQQAQLKFFYDGMTKIVLQADPLPDAKQKL